jgi:hypothetical protein
LSQAVGKQRELQRRALEVHEAKRVAGREAQEFPLLVPPQPIQAFPEIARLRNRLLLLIDELRAAFEIRQSLVLRQTLEVLRIPQQDLGEELAADKQPEQDLDGPRVLGQIAKQSFAVGGRLNESLEVDERRIGDSAVGERMNDSRERPGKEVAFRLCPGESAKSRPRLGNGEKPGRSESLLDLRLMSRIGGQQQRRNIHDEQHPTGTVSRELHASSAATQRWAAG